VTDVIWGTQDWRKSSRSAGNGNCVEWRKSSHSQTNGTCVEVATHEVVQVRDSKDPGPVLTFTPDAWTAFLTDVKAGRLDL
jgi:hypothetical protein